MSSQVSGFPECSLTCPRVAELEGGLEELEEKLAVREEKIKRLQKKLRKYDNPHTPPSKRLGSTKSRSGYSKSKGRQGRLGSGKSGRKKGHKGVTSPQPEPDRTQVVDEENCPHCGTELGESDKTEMRVIEDIAEPQPIEVTEYKISHYKCDGCGEEVVASHEDLPPEGRFGYNVVVQTTLYKYHGGSVHRKTRDLLKWQHGLGVSASTVFDLTRRASDWLRPHYERVLHRIKNASILYVDETRMNVDGSNGWI